MLEDRVYIVKRNGKEVLVVDYSGCKEAEMIQIVFVAKEKLISDNKKRLLVSIYGEETRATPKFMDCVRKETSVVLHLLDKQAVVGLSPVKKIILKSYNFLFKRNIRDFDTKDEAINFLVDDKTTDRDIPDYMK